MKTLLITRYNEYMDWLGYIIDNVDTVIIYNKGSNENYFKMFIPTPEQNAKITIQRIENLGRIDHSIAHFIVNNWDNLPDMLISLPGSILMCRKKGAYLSWMNKALRNMDQWNGFYSPRFVRVGQNFNYHIDEYQAEGACNRNSNKFIKSEHASFQEWKKALIDDRPMKFLAFRGMFNVAKENIQFIDKKIYENLLESLSVGDNIENGHFSERIWAHLFRQKPKPVPNEPVIPVGPVTVPTEPVTVQQSCTQHTEEAS